MKGRHLLFIFALSLVLFLVTGCEEKVATDLQDKQESTSESASKSSQSQTDTIIIYDNNGKELIKTNEQAKIEYFSELIGRSVLSALTWDLSPEDHTLLQNPQSEE